MIPAQFDYEAPRTLDAALKLLANDDARALAGGHSLLPAMKLRLAGPRLLVDLGRIAGLSYVRDAGESIAIGAMTTHTAVVESELLRKRCPLLPQTAKEIGDVQVRNRGTLGGSLAHADPAADYPAAILALDAEIVARSTRGERVIPAGEFFTDLFSTALQPGEIITEVRVPKTNGAGTAYLKFHHPASGFAVVGIAVVVQKKNAAIGVTGVGPNAYRATRAEAAIRGGATFEAASEYAAEGAEPLSDHFASAGYRRQLAKVYTRRALEAASQ